MEKLSRLLLMAVVVAGGWWLWNGPIRDMQTVSPEEQMRINADNMARCMGSEEFVTSATGESRINPEERCARKYNLYREGGHWYRHDQVRRSAG